jgi:hypothetical protein
MRTVISVTRREPKKCEKCENPISGLGWFVNWEFSDLTGHAFCEIVCDECAEGARKKIGVPVGPIFIRNVPGVLIEEIKTP